MLQYVFNGQIDEVALYKRYLNADERTWLFNSGNSRSYSEVTGNTLAYGDPSHDHAATALAGNNYVYDANGNMTQRVIGADTYLLGYDAENRLVQVQKNSVVVASFTYDADGKRVKSIMDGDTTLFVGSHYEVKNGNQITQYYLAGTTRVAMRKYTIPQNMSVEYLLSDHLGSTSLTTDTSGAKVLELRYKAWGEVRATWTASPTTTPAYRSPAYTYTGQYSYMDDPTTSGVTEGFGLMFYNARWYDPALGKFAQADTVIPQSQGTQAWDRYTYVNNNPVNASDPTGHLCEDEDANGHCPGYVPPAKPNLAPTFPDPTPAGATPTSTHWPTRTPTATPTASLTLTPFDPSTLPTNTPGTPVVNIVKDKVVQGASDAVNYCFGPSGMSGAPGCGELIAKGISVFVTLYTGAPPANPEVYGQAFDQVVGWFHIYSDVSSESTPFSYTPNPYTPTSSPTITPMPISVTSTPTSYYSTPTVIIPSSTPTIYWIPR